VLVKSVMVLVGVKVNSVGVLCALIMGGTVGGNGVASCTVFRYVPPMKVEKMGSMVE
jgi:hypothetical protein